MPLAASLERAVTDSAELLLAAGAVLALVYAFTRTRIGVFQWPLLGASVLALGVGAGLGGWAWHEKQPRTVVGSPTEEFSSTLREQPKKTKPSENPSVELTQVQWPTYGYDIQRTHLAPDWRNLRPPFHGLWKLKARADIEFPPSVAYRKVYVAQQKGRFYAINARTGKIVWTKHFPNCSAASPTIADGIVYQAYMHELPCGKHEVGRSGVRHRLEREERSGALACARGHRGVDAAPRREDALLRLLGPAPVRVPDPRRSAGHSSDGRSAPTTRSSPLRRALGTS